MSWPTRGKERKSANKLDYENNKIHTPQNIQTIPREKPICDHSIWSNKASREDMG